jgi:hypothetical protein
MAPSTRTAAHQQRNATATNARVASPVTTSKRTRTAMAVTTAKVREVITVIHRRGLASAGFPGKALGRTAHSATSAPSAISQPRNDTASAGADSTAAGVASTTTSTATAVTAASRRDIVTTTETGLRP